MFRLIRGVVQCSLVWLAIIFLIGLACGCAGTRLAPEGPQPHTLVIPGPG